MLDKFGKAVGIVTAVAIFVIAGLVLNQYVDWKATLAVVTLVLACILCGWGLLKIIDWK